MSDNKALETKFEVVMFDIYRRAKTEAKYNANVFLNMLSDRGGISTAKFLINSEKQTDGFTALHLAKCLHLTVEALVAEQVQWHPLFLPEEIEKARIRLNKNGYEFKQH